MKQKWCEKSRHGLTSVETGRERFQKKWFEEGQGLTFMETGKERFQKKWFEEGQGLASTERERFQKK